jgi:hypothetical protein
MGLRIPESRRAFLQACSTALLSIGLLGTPLSKSHVFGRPARQYARRVSSSREGSIVYRSFWPLPCSTRMTIRLLSMSVGFRWTTSEMRRPVALNSLNGHSCHVVMLQAWLPSSVHLAPFEYAARNK